MSCCPITGWPEIKEESNYKPLGQIHEWPTKGSTLKPGYKFYHKQPKTPSNKVLFFFYDVFGFKGPRSLKMCDQFSENLNCHVILPDLYRNEDSIADHGGLTPEGFGWIKNTPIEDIIPLYEATVEWMIKNSFISSGDAKFQGIGFCWGAWVNFKLANKNLTKYPLTTAANCHPSPIVETMFGKDLQKMYEDISNCNMVLVPAGDDKDDVKKGGLVEKILKEKI